MKHLILIAFTFLFSSLEGFSQVFSTQLSNGNTVYYRITDPTLKKVEITRMHSFNGAKTRLPSGKLEIPSTVQYRDVTYFVMSIGDWAFAGAKELTSVSIPSSICRIGAKAFSGCDNLKSIVFPSCKPSIEKTAFKHCQSLSSISFGSDWTSLDFNLFSDSDSLKSINIPAKIIEIKGIKSLSNLQEIEVDPNNRAFSSHEGMLYSKDGSVFYACPQARTGVIALKNDTETILDGAFGGCNLIKSIYLPASVHAFAYDEFADCSHLSSITLSSEIPPITAKWNRFPVFAIKAPGDKCTLYVPKSSLSRYRTSICSMGGAYESLSGNRRGENQANVMLGKTCIIKNR